MTARNLPADWAPTTAALLVERPELAGIGVSDAVEAVASC